MNPFVGYCRPTAGSNLLNDGETSEREGRIPQRSPDTYMDESTASLRFETIPCPETFVYQDLRLHR
jgi:hypothetical protein